MLAQDAKDEFFYVLQDSLKIVFVDDDPILREFASVHLATENSDIITFSDGADALDGLAAAQPDIILLDLEMPRMDGFEFLEKLRAIPEYATLPVIVCTGREDVRAIDRAFQAGATSFIVKPLNWRLLAYQIRYVDRAARAERTAPAASDALLTLAREGSRFMSRAIARCPDLRADAGAYAQLIETTLTSPRAAGA